ncbi:MAG: TonB-dependent receptor [Moraxellaceae bacterium]|nr:TonB-dependent receptor [Moraxellaceae bacterium]
MVLSASRLAQPRVDAPGAVTVLDREQIRASGLRDVAELLRLVPGFMSTLVDGSYPVASYHGLTRDRSNQMQVLVDGRSVYSPYLLGGIEWNQLGVSIDDIERIEVFRGTNAAAYGANAFLGVVSITTRSALGSPAFSAKGQVGDDGISDFSAAGTLQAGDVGIRLRASQQRDDGFDGWVNGRRVKLADMRADWRLSASSAFEAHLGTNAVTTLRGYATDSRDPPREQENTLSYGLLRFRHTLGGGDELMLSYYHQEERTEDRFDIPTPVPPVLRALFGWPAMLPLYTDFGSRSTRDDLEFQHIASLDETARVVWGLGARQDTLEAPQSFYQRGEIGMDHLRAFSNLEWRAAPHWLLNLGLMVENTSLSGTKASPRVALNYHPAADQALRFAWSRGYRSPTPYEEMSDLRVVYDNRLLRWRYRPAGDLDPERITAVELGYVWESQQYHTLLDVRAYDEKVDKLIRETRTQLPPGTQIDTSTNLVYSYANSTSAHMRGIEYQLMWRPRPSTWVSLGQNYMNIHSSDDNMADSAPHIATVLSASHRWPWSINTSATFYHYNAMRWGQDTNAQLGSYHRLDLRLGYEFRLAGSKSEAFLVGQNLGPDNQEFKPRYIFDRRFFGGLSVEF